MQILSPPRVGLTRFTPRVCIACHAPLTIAFRLVAHCVIPSYDVRFACDCQSPNNNQRFCLLSKTGVIPENNYTFLGSHHFSRTLITLLLNLDERSQYTRLGMSETLPIVDQECRASSISSRYRATQNAARKPRKKICTRPIQRWNSRVRFADSLFNESETIVSRWRSMNHPEGVRPAAPRAA
jgi:hypothetical protein